jgi:hypothetical protein
VKAPPIDPERGSRGAASQATDEGRTDGIRIAKIGFRTLHHWTRIGLAGDDARDEWEDGAALKSGGGLALRMVAVAHDRLPESGGAPIASCAWWTRGGVSTEGNGH